ncbi:hypothetical protein [uncultured Croceitalea sp.]|uniref:toxin-antitoxin system YwqK family antitoxin n=1 Tax=uncultured Croceitalea sp. TaxID=1798908 RepID=UPI003305A786
MITIKTSNILQATLIIAVFFSFSNVHAQKDTIYYDAKWKPAQKDSASFFRPPVKKSGELYVVEDYYISGQLQMKATSKSADRDIWHGTVAWYTEDGNIYQQGSYSNNRLDGDFITYLKGEKLVAKYNKGYFISGKANTPSGSLQRYVEKKNDSLKEVLYDKDINGIRYETFSAEGNRSYLSKYYDKGGKLLGERTLLPNGYYKGVEVFYYYSPMSVRDINYYPFGQLLTSSVYYANGQVREEVGKEPTWSKTFYTPSGKLLGKIAYEIERDRLKPMNGTEFVFAYAKRNERQDLIRNSRTYKDGVLTAEKIYHDNGALKSETSYKNGTRTFQVSYTAEGEELARMVYKDYRPYDGTEIQYDRKGTYKAGELIEEVIYYPKSEIPKSKKTQSVETFYDKEGKVLGELQLEYKNGYTTPVQGKRYTMDYANGDVTAIEVYKEGVVSGRMSFRKRKVGEDQTKTFKRIEEYGNDGYQLIREIKFYSNNKKQSDVAFKNYKEAKGTYYDIDGNEIATYDYENKTGTLYEFFVDSDVIKRIETLENGKSMRLKRYDYGVSDGYGKINPVLVEEIDVNCCATFYSAKGDVLGEVTFKEGKPWEGTIYDSTKRTLHAIKEGKRNGTYKKIDYNTSVLEKGEFINNQEEGVFTYYDYQGDVQRTENYKAGKLDGKATYFDKAGKVTSQVDYKNGLPINGTRILGVYYGKEPNQETYKDGALIERVNHGKNGKTVSLFKDGAETQTTAYYKDSDKKRLQYTMSNTTLDGQVTRYDQKGATEHNATFKNGKLVSGTVLLLPQYQDNSLQYIKVQKNENVYAIKYVDFDGNVVLKAEEKLTEGVATRYLDKLGVDLNYVTGDRLY